MYFPIQIHTPSRDKSVVKVKDVVLTCKEIKLPSFLLILSSSSPIPHSLLLPLTRPALTPQLPFPTLPSVLPIPFSFLLQAFPTCLISPVHFILNAEYLISISHLTIFIQISENIPCVSVIQARTGSFFHTRHSGLRFLCISVKASK